MAATQVITPSVYGEEEAFSTVRLLIGSRPGITFGQRLPTRVTVTPTMATAFAVKAQPSRPRSAATVAPAMPSAATATEIQVSGLPEENWVMKRKAPPITRVAGPTTR